MVPARLRWDYNNPPDLLLNLQQAGICLHIPKLFPHRSLLSSQAAARQQPLHAGRIQRERTRQIPTGGDVSDDPPPPHSLHISPAQSQDGRPGAPGDPGRAATSGNAPTWRVKNTQITQINMCLHPPVLVKHLSVKESLINPSTAPKTPARDVGLFFYRNERKWLMGCKKMGAKMKRNQLQIWRKSLKFQCCSCLLQQFVFRC